MNWIWRSLVSGVLDCRWVVFNDTYWLSWATDGGGSGGLGSFPSASPVSTGHPPFLPRLSVGVTEKRQEPLTALDD